MVRHIHRKFIAGVSALSILVTAVGAGSASAQNPYHPAPGQNRQTVAEPLIAAIVGLAIFGALAAKNKKKRQETAATVPAAPHPTPAPAPKAVPVQPQHTAPVYQQVPQNPYVQPLPPRVQQTLLPSQCLRVFETDQGRKRLYGHRCMQNNYRAVTQLPHHCRRQVWTDRGPRAGWGARCLRKNGYQVARH